MALCPALAFKALESKCFSEKFKEKAIGGRPFSDLVSAGWMPETFSKLFPGQESNSRGVRGHLKNHLTSLFTKIVAVDCFENKSQCYLFLCEQTLNISREPKALPSHHYTQSGAGLSRWWKADLGRFPSLCKFTRKPKVGFLLSPRHLLLLAQKQGLCFPCAQLLSPGALLLP